MNRLTNFPTLSKLCSLIIKKGNGIVATIQSGYLPVRTIHSTQPQAFPGQTWRKKQGLPANPNAYGPLTDGPDYSYLDGRPTPPGHSRIKRAIEQKEISTKIIELTNEVDFAVARHKTRLQNEKDKLKSIHDRKLKPKGNIPPETRSSL